MAEIKIRTPAGTFPDRPVRDAAPLRRVLLIAGSALSIQGLLNIVLGPWLHLAPQVAATADSDARFLGGMLLGMGVTWIYLSRVARIPYVAVALLAGGMLAGAAGRLLSLAIAGPMSMLAIPVTAIEFVIGGIVILLALRARGASLTAGAGNER